MIKRNYLHKNSVSFCLKGQNSGGGHSQWLTLKKRFVSFSYNKRLLSLLATSCPSRVGADHAREGISQIRILFTGEELCCRWICQEELGHEVACDGPSLVKPCLFANESCPFCVVVLRPLVNSNPSLS